MAKNHWLIVAGVIIVVVGLIAALYFINRPRTEPTEWTKLPWKLLRLSHPDKGDVFIRIRTDEPREGYTTAVEISWHYTGGEKGLPPSDVKTRQDNFEEAISELNSNAYSELVHVSTGLGVKEWTFYSPDRQQFMKELNRLLQGQKRFPIEIEFHDDPKWNIWRGMVDAIEKATKNKKAIPIRVHPNGQID